MVALSEITTQVTDATLTINGTKDLTGDNKKQVLFSLTTTDADSTAMSTFTDLDYTSLVITAYKNGTVSTNPLEESPVYTRTILGTHLNKATINLEVTHEATVGSESEFQAGTTYVFDVRFMKTTGITLLRGVHTFQDAPNTADYALSINTGSNTIGLNINTATDAPVLKEVFVEIIKLDDDDEPVRDSNGVFTQYSLERYTNANGDAFTNTNSDQVVRPTSVNNAAYSTLPNSATADNGDEDFDLVVNQSYNVNVILVTDGGSSSKIRVPHTSGGSNFSILLSNVPSEPKVTIIDAQKQTADVNGAGTDKGYNLPSVLVLLEVTPLSSGEVLDEVFLQLTRGKTFDNDGNLTGGTALEFVSEATYKDNVNEQNAADFETDFVTDIGNKRIMAFRITQHSSASPATLIGTTLASNNSSSLTASYPTIASGQTNYGVRTVPHICQESIQFYNNYGTSALGNSINNETVVSHDINVVQIQVEDLDFGEILSDVNVQLSNASIDSRSNALSTFVLRTDTSGALEEVSATSAFTTIDMDIFRSVTTDTTLTSTNEFGNHAENYGSENSSFQVTQEELNNSGDAQTITFQCLNTFGSNNEGNRLGAFMDTAIIEYCVIYFVCNQNDTSTSQRAITLDSTTSPTHLNFLTGTPLTLTDNTAVGANDVSKQVQVIGSYADGVSGLNGVNIYDNSYAKVSLAGFEKINNIELSIGMKSYGYYANHGVGTQVIRRESATLMNSADNALPFEISAKNYERNDVSHDGSETYSTTGVPQFYSGTSSNGSVLKTVTNAPNGTPAAGLFQGIITDNSMTAIERTCLEPTVVITQSEQELLGSNKPTFTITVTENIIIDDTYEISGSGYYQLAPYDLHNPVMRPQEMKITLYKMASAANDAAVEDTYAFTFKANTTVSLEDKTTTAATVNLNAAGALTDSVVNGTQANRDKQVAVPGVYQVEFANGTEINGTTPVFAPGDFFRVYVALGNEYGIAPDNDTGLNTGFTNGNSYALVRLQTRASEDDRLTVKTTSHASSGVAAAEATQDNLAVFTVFDREVGVPTVTIATQGFVDVGSEKIVVNVTANTADIDNTIDYTQLELVVTTNDGSSDTTSTFSYGASGAELDAEGGLTVNSKGSYTVTIVNGNAITGGSGNITLTAGHTVTVKATLKTDYSNGIQSDATTATTIQAKASLKTTGTAANYLLADSSDALDALFDVDLIEKTTLQFSPAHANSGVSSPTTWGDLINSNGISITDLDLTVTAEYETTEDNFTADTNFVRNLTTHIRSDTSFNDLEAIEVDLNNFNSQVTDMRTRATAGETTRMRLTFTLKSTFANGDEANSTLTTTPFQPYLQKLEADSITAGTVTYSTDGEQDSLSWTVNYTPEAWKSDLSGITANYQLMKNNISGKYLDLSTANSLLQATNEVKTTGLGETETTFTKTFTTFARGSGLFPVFTLASTASKSAYAGSNNAHSTETTKGTGEAVKLYTRSVGVQNSLIKASDNTQFLSYVPNGNTISTSFTIDNDGNSALALSHVKGNTTGVDKMINNKPQNAIFATTQTITLKQSGGPSNAVALLFDGVHTLNLTLGTTKVNEIVDALNALECFPSVMNLPGTTGGATAAVWALNGNLLIKDQNGNTLETTASIDVNSTIELTYEGTATATSRVSFVPVTNAANNNCTIGNVTNDTFIPLTSDSTDTTNYSFTNGTNAIPLPTLVIAQNNTTGDVTHVISVESSAAGDISSVATTSNVSLS